MGFDALVLLLVVGVMVVVFVTSIFPVDLTALSGLILLTLIGLVPADHAFRGFASPAVITIIATFFLGASLRNTGVASIVAKKLHSHTGESELRNIIAVMLLAVVLSAFMTNVAAVAVLLPAIVSLAHRSKISPSKLLIPMSFAAVLGGTMTQVGNTANILVSSIMHEKGLEPFGFFDFTPFGFSLLVAGLLLLAFWGKKALPDNGGTERRRAIDLASLYKLEERMLSLEVPASSRLVGETLQSARVGQMLDATVLAIIRQSERILAPAASSKIEANDTLIVRSRLDQLEKLLQFQGVVISEMGEEDAQRVSQKMDAAGLRLVDKGISAWTLKDLDFRNRFGVVVCAIERKDSFILSNLAAEPLQVGDVIHVVGKAAHIDEIAEGPYFELAESEVEVDEFFRSHLCVLETSKEGELVGKTLEDSQVGHIVGLTVLGILRADECLLELTAQTRIEEGDRLIVSGERSHIERLSTLSELNIDTSHSDSDLESRDVGLVEVLLSPRSKLFGQSLRTIAFREKYGFQVLALWRNGKPVRSKIGLTPLQFGDGLLLQGPRDKISLLNRDRDFVLLSEEEHQAERDKAPFAALGLLVMVLLSVTGLQPVHVAAFAGALVAVLSGALSMQDAYREVEWRVVFLVACLIPLGVAVETTGAAAVISGWFLGTAGQYGALGCIVACSLLASALSQTLDGTITVVLLSPICIQIAEQLGVSPYPFFMAIAISSSIAFLTPFSHKAHLLVMGPGSYDVKDYFRVGWPLTLVCFLVLWAQVALWYGI